MSLPDLGIDKDASLSEISSARGVSAAPTITIHTPHEPPLNAESRVDPKACGVCHQATPKYKCSRCLLPYCSVPCSKKHRALHPADEISAIPRAQIPLASNVEPINLARPGTLDAVGMRNSFEVFDDCEQLKTLFKLYPELPFQLEKIHMATLRPTDYTQQSGVPLNTRINGGRQGQNRRSNEQPWTSDRGLEKGRKALDQARRTSGKAGEGVREFSDLVLQIMRQEEDGILAVTEIIQSELVRENTRIIEQMLHEEMR